MIEIGKITLYPGWQSCNNIIAKWLRDKATEIERHSKLYTGDTFEATFSVSENKIEELKNEEIKV